MIGPWQALLPYRFYQNRPALEIQLQSKLELPRVERCRWTAVVTTVADAQVERANVINEWRRGGFVESIEQVEAFRDQLQPEVLTQRNEFRETHIERNVTMSKAIVARQASARKLAISDQRYTSGRAGHAQVSVSKHRRTVRLIRLVVVRVLVAQDVERTARRDLEDGSNREVRQETFEA